MANKWEDLGITRAELNNIEDCLKKEEFRKLLIDYCEEINDPANKKIYQEEITQLEKERGNEVTFIEPKGGYVIKTSLNGSKLAFINVCSNDNVQKPVSESIEKNGKIGSNWSVPHLISPPREDLNKKSKRCTVYDIIFHPEALLFASRNKHFRELLNNISCEAIESNFNVKLDKTNLKFPKMKFKGVTRPLVIRKKIGESPNLNMTDPIDKIYSDIYTQLDSQNRPSQPPMTPSTTKSPQKTMYTTPKYLIKHRTSVDLQDFTYEPTAHRNDAIPTELVIDIDLPLLKTSSDLKLDVSEKSLTLLSEKPAKYNLYLTLPYTVSEERGSAKFDQDSRKLTITLPVLRRNMSVDNDSGVESDHVLSSCNSFEENSPLVTELSEKEFDFMSDLDKLKIDIDSVKNGAKSQNGDAVNQNGDHVSQSKQSKKLNKVKNGGTSVESSENNQSGAVVSQNEEKFDHKFLKENGENLICDGEIIQNGHYCQNGDDIQNGRHSHDNHNGDIIQNGVHSKKQPTKMENPDFDQKDQENRTKSEQISQNGASNVSKSDNRTSFNLFLDPELYYSLPEFSCHTFNDILIYTLRVKNVHNSSFEKIFPTSNCVHIKFYSLSPSFVPIHYSILFEFPSKINADEFISEIWDNNLILQVSFLGETPSNYHVGISEEELEDKIVEEPTNIFNKKINSQENSNENDTEVKCEVMSTETNGVAILLSKSDDQVSESAPSEILTPSETQNHKKLSHSFSESSCDELSVSPTKGILKLRSRTLSRSMSESSVDDYTWSSFENFASVSGEFIPEELEVSSSMKKTVRFNDVVSKQLFRTNSSILGQKRKNQRKSRNKKRAQERRLSESENSEAEDKVNKFLKKQTNNTEKVQNIKENNENYSEKTENNECQKSNDLIFDIDM